MKDIGRLTRVRDRRVREPIEDVRFGTAVACGLCTWGPVVHIRRISRPTEVPGAHDQAMFGIRLYRGVVLAGVIVSLLLTVGDTVSAQGHFVDPIPAHKEAAARTAPEPAASTGFVLPVTGPAVVLTRFRPPPSRYGPGHRGVDLAAARGDPVRAAGAGIVVYAGQLAGRGVVSIDHQVGVRTTYEPVTASVKAGDSVLIGQTIGLLVGGHVACAPATCLHWGARLPDGRYLDPMSLLTGLRVRLLPWDG